MFTTINVCDALYDRITSRCEHMYAKIVLGLQTLRASEIEKKLATYRDANRSAVQSLEDDLYPNWCGLKSGIQSVFSELTCNN